MTQKALSHGAAADVSSADEEDFLTHQLKGQMSF
jgi:hypothetical protein